MTPNYFFLGLGSPLMHQLKKLTISTVKKSKSKSKSKYKIQKECWLPKREKSRKGQMLNLSLCAENRTENKIPKKRRKKK